MTPRQWLTKALGAFGLKWVGGGELTGLAQSRGGWFPLFISEPNTGAWQRSDAATPTTALAYSAVYSCVRLLATSVAKMRLRLVQLGDDGVWAEVWNPAYSPVLEKPNHYQNRIQFFIWWMASKLTQGKTIVLKRRDLRGVVNGLYILDANRVEVLLAQDGSVYYRLSTDQLAGLPESVTVPASEIIHDVCVPLYHPLIGETPITACALAAAQGIEIQRSSARFFQGGAKPGGVLTAPGTIAPETAKRVKEYWDQNFSGDNAGKVAVLGDGLKYDAVTMKAVDAQLIEQLKWTGLDVCAAMGVPAYLVGVGPEPTLANAESRARDFYAHSLQIHVESIELLLDQGLGLARAMGTEFDVDDLWRMDTITQIDLVTKGVGGGVFAPNEGRRRFNLRPVPGGNSVYMQQQYYSLEALAKRDQAPPTPPPEPRN